MQKPTVSWRDVAAKMRADPVFKDIPEHYTELALSATDKILDAFKSNLSRLKARKDRQAILNEVKSVVLKLNELTSSKGIAPDMIETVEREDLCEYIDYWAKDAGLAVEDGVDITEDWREW